LVLESYSSFRDEPPEEMDPKGKGMMINDKEKEALYVDEPKGDKPTDSGSSHKKRDGKKKRCCCSLVLRCYEIRIRQHNC
jgi:hypothetical protein